MTRIKFLGASHTIFAKKTRTGRGCQGMGGSDC